MIKTILAGLLCVAMIPIASMAQEAKFKTYSAERYSLTYPAEWTTDNSKVLGPDLFLFSLQESDSDKFRENVNVLIQDLSKSPMTLAQYTDLSLSQIKAHAVNPSLQENKTIKTRNGDAQHLIYIAEQDQYHLKFEQVYYIIRDKAYVLTFTSMEDKYEKFKKQGEAILESFTLK